MSAAYYAVFHVFSNGLTLHLLPSGTADDRRRLGRSLDHSALKDVCQWVTGKPGAGREHVQSIVAAFQADTGRDQRQAPVAQLRLG